MHHEHRTYEYSRAKTIHIYFFSIIRLHVVDIRARRTGVERPVSDSAHHTITTRCSASQHEDAGTKASEHVVGRGAYGCDVARRTDTTSGAETSSLRRRRPRCRPEHPCDCGSPAKTGARRESHLRSHVHTYARALARAKVQRARGSIPREIRVSNPVWLQGARRARR